MTDIKINDLNEDMQMTEAELNHVKGGIGLLLPAVQKVREAAARNTSITDGTSNTFFVGERNSH